MILTYLYLTEPEEMLKAIDEMAQEPELWIDCETADWIIGAPRVSLIQARNREGLIWVLDMLDYDHLLWKAFVPRVMASPTCRKHAHNASYERKHLGGDQVENLTCTLKMAKAVPHIAQAASGFGLEPLVKQLFGLEIDKMYQRANWGRRPLHKPMLDYAAADAEWCFHIHQMCQGNVDTYRADAPEADERRRQYMKGVSARYPSATLAECTLEDHGPREIRSEYREVIDERYRYSILRHAIERSVQQLMEAHKLAVFGGFRLENPPPDQWFMDVRDEGGEILGALPGLPAPFVYFSNLPLFCTLLDRLDLADEGPVMVCLSQQDRETLKPSVLSRLEKVATISPALSFRGLVARSRSGPDYVATLESEQQVADDYRNATKAHLELNEKRSMLLNQIKTWMDSNEVDRWGGFRYQEIRQTWSIELRTLASMRLPRDFVVEVPERLRPFVTVKTKKRRVKSYERMLRWVPDEGDSE